jgi:hypothetical protein
MSYKDTNAKQAQDCRDRFNHFDDRVTLQDTSGSPRWFQDRFVRPTKWFRADWRRVLFEGAKEK